MCSSDLLHPVLVGADADGAGGVLVPIMCLINGTSITRCEDAEQVDYFHIELDSHDIIIAEGALAGVVGVGAGGQRGDGGEMVGIRDRVEARGNAPAPFGDDGPALPKVFRALVVADENFKKQLRATNLLTRDPREKERKKPGLKKARKAKQYTKR